MVQKWGYALHAVRCFEMDIDTPRSAATFAIVDTVSSYTGRGKGQECVDRSLLDAREI